MTTKNDTSENHKAMQYEPVLAPVVFDNVRSTTEHTSNRKRQCYGTGKHIKRH